MLMDYSIIIFLFYYKHVTFVHKDDINVSHAENHQ